MKGILKSKYFNLYLTGQIFKRHYSSEVTWPRQVFSAIQPTGEAHLGNYLGALNKWVHFQNTEENTVIFAIADLHSITIPKDPKELQKNILTMAATLFACGIDSSKCIFFQQSMIPQHVELCWILSTLTTVPKLSYLPQYKEKCKEVKNPLVGIFLYPVLQAADIMLYKTTHVPVGEDQAQHIAFATHLCKSFNNRFGNTFPWPDVIIDSSCGRIKSLFDPTKKMSKSDPRPKSVISLTDSPDTIVKKCKLAITDFTSELTYDPENRPGVANLLIIHSSITGKTPHEIIEENKHLDTGKYKLVLADIIVEHLKPIRSKINEYMNSPEYLISELEIGANKAREIAERTLTEVKEKVGFSLLCEKSQNKSRESLAT